MDRSICINCDGNPKQPAEDCKSCGFREELLLAQMANETEESE